MNEPARPTASKTNLAITGLIAGILTVILVYLVIR